MHSSEAEILVVSLTGQHWPDVRAIYQEGIDTGNATFETAVPSWESWNATHLDIGRLVALAAGAVAGWAALGPVSSRAVYWGVAEVSVYVRANLRGLGIGKRLLQHLITEAERAGIWTLQAAVFPENETTLRLHASLGFRIVGRRERIATLHGRWRDTLLLERRSRIVGGS